MTEMTKTVKVLLVDDDAHMLTVLRVISIGMGFDVVGEARDGQQALALYQERQPDLTLLDVLMPGMDGIDVLKEIRRMNADARVVMLTATDPAETLDYSFEAGAVDFIRKDWGAEGWIRTLEEICQKYFLQ